MAQAKPAPRSDAPQEGRDATDQRGSGREGHDEVRRNRRNAHLHQPAQQRHLQRKVPGAAIALRADNRAIELSMREILAQGQPYPAPLIQMRPARHRHGRPPHGQQQDHGGGDQDYGLGLLSREFHNRHHGPT